MYLKTSRSGPHVAQIADMEPALLVLS